MLEAYIRAEEFEKAERMLSSRLQQRDSIRDSFWLGRVQVEQGQTSQANANFQRARLAWEDSGSANPELTNLRPSPSIVAPKTTERFLNNHQDLMPAKKNGIWP